MPASGVPLGTKDPFADFQRQRGRYFVHYLRHAVASQAVDRGNSTGGARLPGLALMAEGGAESQLTSSTGWHAEVRVDRRMPPIGVQCGSRRRSGLVGPAAGRDPGSPGRPAWASGHPRRPRGLPLACYEAMGSEGLPALAGGLESPRPNALTTPRASDMLTHPPDRPPRSVRQPKETRRRSNPSGAVLRNTRHQHRQ